MKTFWSFVIFITCTVNISRYILNLRFFVTSFFRCQLFVEFVVELQSQTGEEVPLTGRLYCLETEGAGMAELQLFVELVLLLLLTVPVPGVQDDPHDCGHRQEGQDDQDDHLDGNSLTDWARGRTWW